jgi:hypothetical protein
MSTYQISTDANGTFAVVAGQINADLTSLKLVGRGAAGYGFAIAENTIKHLSNFAGANQPNNPLKGQLWFDTSKQCLQVYVNSTVGWAEVPVAGFSSKFVSKDELYGAGGTATSPLMIKKGGTGLTAVGTNGQVLTSNGTAMVWQNPQAALITALGTGSNGQVLSTNGSVASWQNAQTALLATLGTHSNGQVLSSNGTAIVWKTPQESLLASVGAGTNGQVLTSNGTSIVWAAPSPGATALRTDISTFPTADNTIDLGTSARRFNEIYASTFRGTAIQAQYADVAERYAADHPMTPGDLVDIGGEKDITLTTAAWQSAFGVISTAPAFKMNSEAGDDITHPYVALIGRVPVKVIGQVAKGDRLTASDTPGVAMSAGKDNHPGVFGRALTDKTTDELGFVEVALGAK